MDNKLRDELALIMARHMVNDERIGIFGLFNFNPVKAADAIIAGKSHNEFLKEITKAPELPQEE